MKSKRYETGLDKFNKIHKSTNVVFNIFFALISVVCVAPALFVT